MDVIPLKFFKDFESKVSTYVVVQGVWRQKFMFQFDLTGRNIQARFGLL